jgi:hypothetical protein
LYSGGGTFTPRASASANLAFTRPSIAPGCAGSLRIPSSSQAACTRVSQPDFAAWISAHFTVLKVASDQLRAIASWMASAITSPGTPDSVASRYPFAQAAIESAAILFWYPYRAIPSTASAGAPRQIAR